MFNMLNARLPRMKCPDGCGECCGMVKVSEWEARKIAAYIVRENVKPQRQGTTCPFFQDNRCAIYPVRPVICRLYGHIDDPLMTCPKGCNVNIKSRLVSRINKEYAQSCKGALVMIHTLAYSKDEVDALWSQATQAIIAAADALKAAEEKPPSSLIMVPAIPPEPDANPAPGNQPEREADGETDGSN